MKKLLIVLSTAALAAAILGCGGSGDSPATMSRGQFRKVVNRLCTKTENRKYNDIGIIVRKNRINVEKVSPEGLEKIVVGVILPLFDEMTVKLREMPLPAGEETQASEVIAEYEADIRKTREQPKRFLDGVAFSEGNEAAKRLGLTDCVF